MPLKHPEQVSMIRVTVSRDSGSCSVKRSAQKGLPVYGIWRRLFEKANRLLQVGQFLRMVTAALLTPCFLAPPPMPVLPAMYSNEGDSDLNRSQSNGFLSASQSSGTIKRSKSLISRIRKGRHNPNAPVEADGEFSPPRAAPQPPSSASNGNYISPAYGQSNLTSPQSANSLSPTDANRRTGVSARKLQISAPMAMPEPEIFKTTSGSSNGYSSSETSPSHSQPQHLNRSTPSAQTTAAAAPLETRSRWAGSAANAASSSEEPYLDHRASVTADMLDSLLLSESDSEADRMADSVEDEPALVAGSHGGMTRKTSLVSPFPVLTLSKQLIIFVCT